MLMPFSSRIRVPNYRNIPTEAGINTFAKRNTTYACRNLNGRSKLVEVSMTKTNRNSLKIEQTAKGNSLKIEQTAKGITIRVLVSARLPQFTIKFHYHQQAQSNIV
jgi:hypothetical protein